MSLKKKILSLFIATIFSLSLSACGSDDGSGGTATGTANDANVAINAAFEALGQAMSAASAGDMGALVVSGETLPAFTVTQTTSCEEAGVPDPAGSDYSGTVEDGSGGSCTLDVDGDSSGFEMLLDCADFTSSNGVIINGMMGFEATGFDETGGVIYWGSENLTMANLPDQGQTICDVIINITEDLSITESNATITINGCVTVCGSGFSINGSLTNQT